MSVAPDEHLSFPVFKRKACISEKCWLYKPVSDWLEMLSHRTTVLNMLEYFLLHMNHMERNDLWLNVKGNCILLYTHAILK